MKIKIVFLSALFLTSLVPSSLTRRMKRREKHTFESGEAGRIPRTLVLGSLFLILELLFSKSVFAQSATVSLSPDSGSLVTGSTLEVEVKIDAQEAATVAKVYINFDSSKLTGATIDTGGSAFTTAWPEATFDNSNGMVKLQAAQSNPGVSGEVTLATLTFSAKEAGDAVLSLDSSSLLLTSDDRNLLSDYPTIATLTVTAPTGASSSSGGSSGGGGGGGGGSSGGGGGGSSGGGGGGGGSSGGGACAKRGDVDCNGRIDLTDLSRMLANWRRNFAAADFNGSGIVDIVDLSILLANWRR